MKTTKSLSILILSFFLISCASKPYSIYRHFDSIESSKNSIAILKGGNNYNIENTPRNDLYYIKINTINNKTIPKYSSIYLEPGVYNLHVTYHQLNNNIAEKNLKINAQAGKTYKIIGILNYNDDVKFKVITTNTPKTL
jgi:hypothetical protein